MEEEPAFPLRLMANAFAGGEPATAKPSRDATRWVLTNAPPKIRPFLKAPPRADPGNWRDPRVGWGLVLPDNPRLSQAQLSSACDAPEPIQALVRSRGHDAQPAPVLRYKHGIHRTGFLRRDGADLPISQSAYGTGPAAVPRYLLIYGTPEQIPWDVQYGLNATRFVGRLDLQGVPLENYVRALMSEWKEWKDVAAANFDAAVVWATDHGSSDITRLMRQAIAGPVVEKLRADRIIGPNTIYIDGSIDGAATAKTLIDKLEATKPGFILTTSHGMTGPLDHPEEMTAQLGLPVDKERSVLHLESLLTNWQPAGAIWYAHACCSAGSDSHTLFDGLIEAGSMVDLVLKGVAKAGARIAPLPSALLGAREPLRAFIGHVEPTFDWTLEQMSTKQFTTEPITAALYDELFQPAPIGQAMGSVFGQLGGLYADYDRFFRVASESNMLHRLLIARDVQSTVILGDPTAMLPL
jgi:hypothetical protein